MRKYVKYKATIQNLGIAEKEKIKIKGKVIDTVEIEPTDLQGGGRTFYIWCYAIENIDEISNNLSPDYLDDINRIVLGLIGFTNGYVSELEKIEDTLFVVRKSVTCTIDGKIVVPYSEQDREHLKRQLYYQGPLHQYDKLFEDIMKIKDDISRYIMLYGILELRYGTQKDIDIAIKQQEPNVKLERTRRSNKNFDETVYTWLRNQYGHPDLGTKVEDIDNEISKRSKEFTELVFKLLYIV